jgi:hypothetical protein
MPRDAASAGCVTGCDSDHILPAKIRSNMGQNFKQRDVARQMLGGVPSPLFCGGLRD